MWELICFSQEQFGPVALRATAGGPFPSVANRAGEGRGSNTKFVNLTGMSTETDLGGGLLQPTADGYQ